MNDENTDSVVTYLTSLETPEAFLVLKKINIQTATP